MKQKLRNMSAFSIDLCTFHAYLLPAIKMYRHKYNVRIGKWFRLSWRAEDV